MEYFSVRCGNETSCFSEAELVKLSSRKITIGLLIFCEKSNLPCCRMLCNRGRYNVVWPELKSVSARFPVSASLTGSSPLQSWWECLSDGSWCRSCRRQCRGLLPGICFLCTFALSQAELGLEQHQQTCEMERAGWPVSRFDHGNFCVGNNVLLDWNTKI